MRMTYTHEQPHKCPEVLARTTSQSVCQAEVIVLKAPFQDFSLPYCSAIAIQTFAVVNLLGIDLWSREGRETWSMRIICPDVSPGD